VSSDEEDQSVLNAVHAEYRLRCDLLTPERIKNIRKRYRLSQKSFAALLGMSEATINRYEKGGLQDGPHEELMRACQDPAFMRGLLKRKGHLLSDWQRQRAEQALAGRSLDRGNLCDYLCESGDLSSPRAPSEETGYRPYEPMRMAAVMEWFCVRLGEVKKTLMVKLPFYSDFLRFKTATVSLTGSPYRHAAYGPVPVEYGFLLDWLEQQGTLVCREVEYPNGNTGFHYSSGPVRDNLGIEFTPSELRVLEHVADTIGSMGSKEVSDRSHEEAGWRKTEDGQLIPYKYAMELSLSLTD